MRNDAEPAQDECREALIEHFMQALDEATTSDEETPWRT